MMLDNFEVRFQRELMVNDSTTSSFNLMKETFQFKRKVWPKGKNVFNQSFKSKIETVLKLLRII